MFLLLERAKTIISLSCLINVVSATSEFSTTISMTYSYVSHSLHPQPVSFIPTQIF